MLKVVTRWLRARMTLGWALAKHVMMGPFARHRSDPKRWLARMRKEQLGRTAVANWPRFAGSSKCLGCGLCDLFGDTTVPRPSLMIQGSARLPSDAPWVHPQAVARLEAIAPDVAQVCPAGVQTADIGALIAANQAILAERTAVD
jgi:hypothetical protein